jgi:hypothetical protein
MLGLLNGILKYNYGMNPVMNDYLVNYMKNFLNNKIEFHKKNSNLFPSILTTNGVRPPERPPIGLILTCASFMIFNLITKRW